MKIGVKTLMSLGMVVMLNGCSVYKSSFDCPASKGIGCESVSTVNELINDEMLDEYIAAKQSKKGKNKASCPKCASNNTDEKPINGIVDDKGQNTEKMRVHFNAYQGSDGILHKSSEIEVALR